MNLYSSGGSLGYPQYLTELQLSSTDWLYTTSANPEHLYLVWVQPFEFPLGIQRQGLDVTIGPLAVGIRSAGMMIFYRRNNDSEADGRSTISHTWRNADDQDIQQNRAGILTNESRLLGVSRYPDLRIVPDIDLDDYQTTVTHVDKQTQIKIDIQTSVQGAGFQRDYPMHGLIVLAAETINPIPARVH